MPSKNNKILSNRSVNRKNLNNTKKRLLKQYAKMYSNKEEVLCRRDLGYFNYRPCDHNTSGDCRMIYNDELLCSPKVLRQKYLGRKIKNMFRRKSQKKKKLYCPKGYVDCSNVAKDYNLYKHKERQNSIIKSNIKDILKRGTKTQLTNYLRDNPGIKNPYNSDYTSTMFKLRNRPTNLRNYTSI